MTLDRRTMLAGSALLLPPHFVRSAHAQLAQTAPGKAWFAYFRLYGPLEPYLDRSWKLSDFEVVS